MENILDKLVETYPKTFSNPSPNYLTKHAIIWNSEFMNISGDTSFHLAYTYMRCGKIQYALEEIRKAIKAYNFIDPASISLQFPDSLPADDHSFLPRKSDLDLMQKTRHAWGLLAVITCNMGADPEAREECQMALRNVKCLTVGPYQNCDQELERLQKILEFNKARHQDSVSPSSASSPSQALAENWKGAAEKIKQELKEHEEQLAKLKEKELATAEAQESRVIDWNFLFSHAILFAVAGFICSIVLAVLPYSMFRGGF